MNGKVGTQRLGERSATLQVALPLRWPALLLAAAGLLLGYAPTIQTLWGTWRHNPNYSHGVLIAPVAAWLVWRRRRALRGLSTGEGSWWGALLLVPAVALQVIGLRGEVATLQGTSLILALAGIIWQLYGTRVVRELAFPLAFLFFMIPVLPWFMNVLSFKLKILAAGGAVAIAQGLGVAVQREGVNLLFPGGVLAVENACSGLRSLIALLALGALFAYMSSGSLWRRAALFLLAVPIAVAANIARIAALCIYAGLAGTEAAAGAFHDLGGYALFALAFLMLAGCKKILRC